MDNKSSKNPAPNQNGEGNLPPQKTRRCRQNNGNISTTKLSSKL